VARRVEPLARDNATRRLGPSARCKAGVDGSTANLGTQGPCPTLPLLDHRRVPNGVQIRAAAEGLQLEGVAAAIVGEAGMQGLVRTLRSPQT